MDEQSDINRLAGSVGASTTELAEFAALEQEQLDRLVAGFEQAQRRQREELEEGIEVAISYVPAPMRRAVLRVLRGKGKP